jgi:putative transposase
MSAQGAALGNGNKQNAKAPTGRSSTFPNEGDYGAFSVSESKIPEVKGYIANQVEHHRRMSYQDEFRKLCERHGIELDERYAWD